MIVRCMAQFASTLPDDMIEEDGEIVQYPGKGVAFAVADILVRLGCKIEGPEHAYEHGWDFHAVVQGRRFFGQVTSIDEFLLIFENPAWLDRVLNRQPQIYLDLLRGLARELAADPRFLTVTWYTRAEFASDAPGGSVPVEEGEERRYRRRR